MALDFAAIAPLLVLTAGTVLLLALIAIRRNAALATAGAVVTLLAAIASLPLASAHRGPFTSLLIVDAFTLFFQGLILASATATALLSHAYLARRGEEREEFAILLLLATLGAALLAAAHSFVSFFLALETLSVGLYGMIAYLRDERPAIEAGLKYLVLAAGSSAFLLIGMAFIYAQLGALDLPGLAAALGATTQPSPRLLVAAGMALLLVGVGFKLALVPFHMWTPDVYVGAPAPVTGFIASASKAAAFAVLARFVQGLGLASSHGLVTWLMVVAIASMLAGNLLALLQRDVKRILAYSSIGHLGYALVALIAGGVIGLATVALYLAAYSVTILGAFAVVTALSGPDREARDLDDWRGLFWRRPWLAALMTGCVLSLAGIPLTVGFIAKYQVFVSGASAAIWLPVLVLIASSAIGIFYYLRIVVAMFGGGPAHEAAVSESLPLGAPGGPAVAHEVGAAAAYSAEPPAPEPVGPPRAAPLGPAAIVVLVVLAFLLIALGVYPGPLQDAAGRAAIALAGPP